MGRAVGGAAAAGCGSFTLAGLLVGVGLTVWLGSMALSGSADGPDQATTTTGPPVPGTASITVKAPATLRSGDVVEVRGIGFGDGAVDLTLCLTRPLPDAPEPCDHATDATVPIDAGGTFTHPFETPRVVSVAGTRYDCAAAPGACSLRAHPRGSSTGPTAPVSFSPDLGPSDAIAPPSE